MNDEDFIQIEAELRVLCTSIGVPELTEARFYQERDGVDGPERPMAPRVRVLAQLEALDRLLSLYDRSTYQRAMLTIHDLLVESRDTPEGLSDIPTGAIVQFSDGSAFRERAFDLAELPNLGELRQQLNDLKVQLSES